MVGLWGFYDPRANKPQEDCDVLLENVEKGYFQQSSGFCCFFDIFDAEVYAWRSSKRNLKII